MVCIYCSSKTSVINSRPQKRLGTTWRRRQCQNCGAVFTSLETPDLTASVRVRRADGSLVPFERDVLFMSIAQALGHRSDAVMAAGALTATIIAAALGTTSNGLMERTGLITVATDTLTRFDRVAATHYVAYHPLT